MKKDNEPKNKGQRIEIQNEMTGQSITMYFKDSPPPSFPVGWELHPSTGGSKIYHAIDNFSNIFLADVTMDEFQNIMQNVKNKRLNDEHELEPGRNIVKISRDEKGRFMEYESPKFKSLKEMFAIDVDRLTEMLRQSVHGRLAGYEDGSDRQRRHVQVVSNVKF
jgi:hypothetical protein